MNNARHGAYLCPHCKHEVIDIEYLNHKELELYTMTCPHCDKEFVMFYMNKHEFFLSIKEGR